MSLEPEALDRILREFGAAQALHPQAGIATAVIDNGTTHFATLGREVDPNTPMEIGSLTKAFTGLLLAEMIERGEIELAMRIDELLFGERWPGAASITVLDLATHTSGLPRLSIAVQGCQPHDPYRDLDRNHVLDWLAQHKPQLPAEPSFAYSNFGYAVLGLAMESAASLPYELLLQERILKRLGLNETQLQTVMTPNLVRGGFNPTGARVQPWHHDAYAPCGGLVSTANDLAKALRVWNEANHPAAALLQAAIQPRQAVPAGSIGFAWLTPADGGWSWHNGATAGYSAYLAVSPHHRAGIVLLANQCLPQPLTGLGHALMKSLLTSA